MEHAEYSIPWDHHRLRCAGIAYYYGYYLRLLVMAAATSAAEWLLSVAGAGTRLSITTK